MRSAEKTAEQLLALNDLLLRRMKLLEAERAALRMMAQDGLARSEGEVGAIACRDALLSIMNMLNLDLVK